MRLSIVVAASENNVIGKKGQLPWSLPDDLQHFRSVTMGKPVIMGRKTYTSIGRPLPKRTNIVVSRDAALQIPGCTVTGSLDEALTLARRTGAEEACIIGGGELYRLALNIADRLYLTRVHTTIEGGDVFFPDVDPLQWKRVHSLEHAADENHAFTFTMEEYERRSL
jgi:dihydrofolate reductase